MIHRKITEKLQGIKKDAKHEAKTSDGRSIKRNLGRISDILEKNYLTKNIEEKDVSIMRGLIVGDSKPVSLDNIVLCQKIDVSPNGKEKTINIIHKASDSQYIAIICETPQDVVRLVEGGVPIKKVNIGNMHMAEGKRQVSKAVCVDDNDVKAFRRLQELGVDLEIRRVPSESAESLDELFK